MTLFGNRVIVDVTKLRFGHAGLGWVLNPMTGVLIIREGLTHENESSENE